MSTNRSSRVVPFPACLAIIAGAALGASAADAQVERIIRPVQTEADAYGIAQLDDGYATIANATITGGGGTQQVLVLTRHTLGGAVLWQRYLVGPRNDRAFCIEATRDRGFVIAGETDAVDPNQAHTTVIKTDGLGNLLWARSIPAVDFASRPIEVGLREDRNGNYIVVHSTRFPGSAAEFGAAALLTPAGNVLWSQAYRDPRVQTPFTAFEDVRETVGPNNNPLYVVVGHTARDQGTVGRSIALYLNPADGSNPLTREYSFLGNTEEHHANAVLPVSREKIRVVGRFTDAQNGFDDDAVVWDLDPALQPVTLAAIYPGVRLAHAGIAPSFTAVGVTTHAGHFVFDNGDEDALLMTLSISPPALVWSNLYRGARPEGFRALFTRPDSIIAAGYNDSFVAGQRWIYTARTDPFGITSCETRFNLDPRTPEPRSVAFEMPRLTVPVRDYPMIDPRTEWFQRVVCNRCPADFNEDGFLDFFDYDDYVNCFENGVCPPGQDADFNGDGFVDFFDYDAYVAAFERGC
ncbi:MAG: hypothetical protein HEQ23_15915 [Tepidisphaera sp.]